MIGVDAYLFPVTTRDSRMRGIDVDITPRTRCFGRHGEDSLRVSPVSFLLAGLAWAIDGGPILRDHAILVAGMAALTALALALAPLYHRWYRHMRAPGADERDLAPIQPPPDG